MIYLISIILCVYLRSSHRCWLWYKPDNYELLTVRWNIIPAQQNI